MTCKEVSNKNMYYYDICKPCQYGYINIGIYIFKSFYPPTSFDIASEITDSTSENFVSFFKDYHHLGNDPYIWNSSTKIYIYNIRKI